MVDLSIYGSNAEIASWFSPDAAIMGNITGSKADAGPPGPFDLWKIQLGLGSVMIEYRVRFNNLWYAVHPPSLDGGATSPNWDMAHYQILEMTEIQEVGEITRPGRKAALIGFEQSYLDPLDSDILAKNLTQFETDYRNAVDGCNGCHAAAKSADFPNGYKFVKVTMPTAPGYENVDWNGQ